MPFKNPHPLYSTWQGMLSRCSNPNYLQYADYGGRGIKVCDQWLRNFKQFATDMGERPKNYTLDRINNNGNYSPENCRWATRLEQQRNRRIGVQSVTYDGVTYIIADLARQIGMKHESVYKRSLVCKTLAELIDPNKRVHKAGLALGIEAARIKKQALTHCKNEHEFTLENTLITKEGWRRCRTCHRNKMRIRQGYGLAK